jgi:hypothetical protein
VVLSSPNNPIYHLHDDILANGNLYSGGDFPFGPLFVLSSPLKCAPCKGSTWLGPDTKRVVAIAAEPEVGSDSCEIRELD